MQPKSCVFGYAAEWLHVDRMQIYVLLFVCNCSNQQQREATGKGGRVSEDTWFTVKEVAAKLKISIRTVRELIKSDKLPASRIGKEYRIRQSDLEKFLEDSK